MTSSTNTDLSLRVRAVRLTPTGGATSTRLEVVVSRGSLESHQWAIPVEDSAFLDDTTTGNASVDAGSDQLGQYGSVNLSAQPQGPPTTKVCADGSSATIYNESIGGSVDFATGTGVASPWGRVSGQHLAFTGSSRLIEEFGTADDSCFGPAPSGLTACTPGIQWSSPYGSNGSVSGGWRSTPHGRTGQVTATHTIMVGAAGSPTAVRTDTDHRSVAIPTASVWRTHAEIRVVGNPTQAVTGTATFTSAVSPVVTFNSCPSTGRVRVRSFGSSVEPGGSPLTIRQALGGPIVLSRHAFGGQIRFIKWPGQSSLR